MMATQTQRVKLFGDTLFWTRKKETNLPETNSKIYLILVMAKEIGKKGKE